MEAVAENQLASCGNAWTRNLTSHPKVGIGAWSDKEIARAIRSGMARDGRPLHWQGMIWDHASNLDEEDVRAIIAYLRYLPPVEREVPPFHHPEGSDCKRATIYLVEDMKPVVRRPRESWALFSWN